MRNKILNFNRILSFVMVFVMLFSSITEAGVSFFQKSVFAQASEPVLEVSVSVPSQDITLPGDEEPPVGFETPDPTEPPVGFETPEPTEPPTETVTPEPTQPPIETTTPDPTEPPVEIVTPEPTEAPVETVTPEPTEAPIETKTPDPTEPPVETVTPDPTQAPSETPTPVIKPHTPEDDFTWIDITGGVEITGYKGSAVTSLNIPQTLDGKAVLSIGEHALQNKALEALTLNENLQTIKAYAFADNQISGVITLPAQLTSVGDYAFRDNKLTSLTIPPSVKTIGIGAFINNQIATLSIQTDANGLGLTTIGNVAFRQNRIIEVNMPLSITSMGTSVFTLNNNRLVKILTQNTNITTQYNATEWGHVVNPVTVIVKHVDTDGNTLISDKTIGKDMSNLDEIFEINKAAVYTPPALDGFVSKIPQVNFTPNADPFTLVVEYLPTTIPPVIEKGPISIPSNATDEQVATILRETLKATDLQGTDITEMVEISHAIDTSVNGKYPVTYKVTDQWGNTTQKVIDALVGIDWMQYPIGNGWVLSDFTYSFANGTRLTGFTAQGKAKYDAGNTDLVVPHISPHTLLPVKIIFTNYDTPFKSARFTSVDFSLATELEEIGVNAFQSAILTSLDLSPLTKLRLIDNSAFSSSPLTSLDLSQNSALEVIGNSAFLNSKLTGLDLSHNTKLTKIGDNSFMNAKITHLDLSANTLLTYIGSGAFKESPLESLQFSQSCQILMIGDSAFQKSKMSHLDLSTCLSLSYIGNYAFQDNLNLVNISFAPDSAITAIGKAAFKYSKLSSFSTENLPNLEFLGDEVFYSSQLSSLDLTNSPDLLMIGKSAFYNTRLSAIDLSQNTNLLAIGDYAFVSAQLTALDLSANTKLESIGEFAFRSSKLTSLRFGALPNFKVIGKYAFEQALLTTIDFSQLPMLKHIGDASFNKSPLTNLDLRLNPELSYIGSGSFAMSTMESLNFSENPKLSFIGDSAFASNAHLTQITFGYHSKLQYIGGTAFSKARLNSLDLSQLPALRVIGGEAFKSSELTELSFASNPGLMYIGDGAFEYAHLSVIDLSPINSLLYLGRAAFRRSKVNEVWINPAWSTLTLQPSSTTAKNSELYDGLLNGDTAVFRTKSGEAMLPSNPEGTSRYPFILYYQFDINDLRLEYPLYNFRRSDTKHPWSYPTSYGPKDLGKTWDQTRIDKSGYYTITNAKFIVNPTVITVHSVDTDGNVIAPPYTVVAPPGESYTVVPRPYYGYRTPEPQDVVLDAPFKEVTFVYEPLDPGELPPTSRYHLEQRYNTPEEPDPYLIGDRMTSRVYLDLSGFDAELIGGRIEIRYDTSYYDERSIEIPSSPLIKNWRAENGVITIELENLAGGASLDVPIHWRFKKYVTPEYTPMPISALLIDSANAALAQANDVAFQGYYPDPNIVKMVEGKALEGVILRNFQPSPYEDDQAIGDVATEFVNFNFSISDLQRNVAGYTITDTLPSYTAIENGVQSERRAIFVPEANPGWTRASDGLTVTYTGDAGNSRNTPVPPLKLRFPYAAYFNNILNAVSGVLTPFDQSEFEDEMLVQDDITFLFGEVPEQLDVFNKGITKPHYEARKAYFYDVEAERNLAFPWEITVNTLGKGVMNNVIITDYELDERMYYDSISVPTTLVGATIELINADGVTFKTLTISNQNIAIPYQDGILTKQIKIKVASLNEGFHTLTIYTRLIDPENTHYDPTPGSQANVFSNKASLEGTFKNTGEALYLEDIDYLYIHLPTMRVSPIKQQTVRGNPTEQICFPGDAVRYNLYVADKTLDTLRDVLLNFYMVDLLPTGVSIQNIILSEDFLQSQGTYEIVDDYNALGRSAIIFRSPRLQKSKYFQIATINTIANLDIKDGDTYTNEVFMDFDNTNVENIGETVYSQVDPDRTMSRAETTFTVSSTLEALVYKSIRKQGMTNWSFTGIETPSNAPFDYRLSYYNATNADRTNIVNVDVLPYKNDSAIVPNQYGIRLPRGSQFANFFDTSREVTVSHSGYSVLYYNADEPIAYGASTEATLDNLPWSASPAANTIAVRIVQNEGVVLAPNETLHIVLPMLAPDNADMKLSGLRAYNTFVRKDNSSQNLYLEPSRVWNMIPFPVGSIQLKKVDYDTREALAGAIFELRDVNGQYVGEATTGDDGIARFENVRIGDYTIIETEAPIGYGLLTDPITVTRAQMEAAENLELDLGEITNIKLPPSPIFGNIIIEKRNALGNPIVGVKFQVKGLDNHNQDVEMAGTTNAEGRVTFSHLPGGRYRITEMSAPGQLQPITPIEVEIIEDGQVIDLTGDNSIINDKAALKIYKIGITDENTNLPITDYNNMHGTPLANAVFNIYLDDGVTIVKENLTSNPQGRIDVNDLQIADVYGNEIIYRLREMTGVAGFDMYTEDIRFVVDVNGKLFHVGPEPENVRSPFKYGAIYVPNERIKQQGQIVITKTGGVDAHLLAGAEFTIYIQNDAGEWTPVETIESDENGIAISSLLGKGVYQIKETKAPVGYAPSSKVFNFTINKYPLPGEPLVHVFECEVNNPKLELGLIKYEMIAKSVTYAEAQAIASGNSAYRIVNMKFEEVPDGTDPLTVVHVVLPLNGVNFGLFLDGVQVGPTKVTADGFLLFDETTIDLDKIYYLRELSTPTGYQPITDDIEVNIKDYTRAQGFNGRIIIPVQNSKALGQISVSKYNRPSNEAMEGVTFKLTGPRPDTTERVAVTNADGYISWTNLPFGVYDLVETATIPGYELDDTPRVIEITYENPHITEVYYNDQIKQDVTVIKVDRDTGVFLEGSKFALFTLDDVFVKESVTHPDTKYEMFYDVVFGSYWLKEIKAPPGYRLNLEPILVTIDAKTPVIPTFTYKVKDSKIVETLPDTGTFGALSFLAGGVALLGVGIWFSRRKKVKSH